MNIGLTIRRARKISRLSQGELAARAGVALATVQNIELGRANPSIKTLQSIFKILHIKFVLELERKRTESSTLAALGCPIMSEPSGIVPTREVLIQELRDFDFGRCSDRERRAVAAWLMAIRDHYPSVWQALPRSLSAWAGNQESSPKLRRIALSKLSEYL